jgi:hypothetical protein
VLEYGLWSDCGIVVQWEISVGNVPGVVEGRSGAIASIQTIRWTRGVVVATAET